MHLNMFEYDQIDWETISQKILCKKTVDEISPKQLTGYNPIIFVFRSGRKTGNLQAKKGILNIVFI